MKFIHGFFMSLGMFSAIPCPYRPWNENARNLMLVFLPVVGLLLGFLWYGIYQLMDFVNLPLQLQAAGLMLYPFVITGFIHLDGFMDTSDAILSRRPLEDKLRILKDPHTGAFAVISVGILFIICYAAMSTVLEQVSFARALDIVDDDPMLSLILIPVITRCCSALAVLTGKPLAHSQYGGGEEKKKATTEVLTIILMALLTIGVAALLGTGMLMNMATSYSILLVLLVVILAYLITMMGAVRHLKGVSGDLAGYALTIAEAFALVAMALI